MTACATRITHLPAQALRQLNSHILSTHKFARWAFLATLNMIATYFYLAAQWLFVRSFDATTDIILSLLSFPTYVINSVKEGATNWYTFFFVTTPLCFAAMLRIAVYLGDTIADLYEDAIDNIEETTFYITTILPSSFHETFGHPISDLSPEDWSNAYLCLCGFLLYLIICFCHKKYNSLTPQIPSSPTILAEEGKAESFNLASDTSTPAPALSLVEPFDLGHFYTPNFFTTRRPYSQKHFVLTTTPAPTIKARPYSPTPSEQPKEAQPTATIKITRTDFNEATRPLYGAMKSFHRQLKLYKLHYQVLLQPSRLQRLK
jgi:hypothetical protein